MMRAFLAFLCLCFAFPAMAETVQVTASEETAATRLVLDFKTRPTWSLRRKGVGYRLHFSSVAPLRFDLSAIFREIDRARVADVRAIGNNTLDIDLACNCDLIPSQAGEKVLVLDISNTVPLPPKVHLEAPVLQPPTSTDASSEVQSSPEDITTGFQLPPVLGVIDVPDTPILNGVQTFGALPGLQEDSVVLGGAAVEMLAHALARAASQGLVDADPDALQDHRIEANGRYQQLEDRGNLAVSTGFDTALPSDLRDIAPTETGTVCLSNRSIDVASWGKVEDTAMLGRLRTEAIAEDGHVTSDGALELARYYIFLGFGAEARRTSIFMEPSTDLQIILALADVMDRGVSEAEVLANQVGCKGAVSLWALLAAPIDPSQAPENTNDLLATFSALPAHLRTHLGPLLSERLHDTGLQEQARTAINAVTRGGNSTEESELARARLDLEGTHAPEARDTLADLSNGTSLTAAGALLELLKDAEHRGMPPNPSWVEDAPTLVDALEGTEIAERLNVAGLTGLIALGRYGKFRDEIARDSPGVTPETRKALVTAALVAALRNGSDAEFLSSEIAFSDLVSPEGLARELRTELSNRLVQIGLATRAAAYVIAKPETLEELRAASDVLARTGEEEAAVDLVRSSELDATEQIFAGALVTAGHDSEAISAFKEAGENDQARAAAIRTGDWDWVAENGDDAIAAAARRLTQPIAPDVSEQENANGALIASTRERRAKMRELLSFTTSTSALQDFTN